MIASVECSLFSPEYNEKNYLALSAPHARRGFRFESRASSVILKPCSRLCGRLLPLRSCMCGRLLPLRGKALPACLPASAAPRPRRGCLAGVRTRRAASRPKPAARARQRAAPVLAAFLETGSEGGKGSALLGGNAPLESLYSIRPGEHGEYNRSRALL